MLSRGIVCFFRRGERKEVVVVVIWRLTPYHMVVRREADVEAARFGGRQCSGRDSG